MNIIKISKSEEETKSLAFDLAKNAGRGDIFCLAGEMASGKTVFAKGFAKGLGVAELVVSPTFAILGEYVGKFKFYHFDVYRLEGNFDEFAEYLYADGICLIEWADLIKTYIPKKAIWIQIMKSRADENVRKIIIQGQGFGTPGRVN
jgi:tRNA threonylcarbamoyladenosine biosynthesis protein TsaE